MLHLVRVIPARTLTLQDPALDLGAEAVHVRVVVNARIEVVLTQRVPVVLKPRFHTAEKGIDYNCDQNHHPTLYDQTQASFLLGLGSLVGRLGFVLQLKLLFHEFLDQISNVLLALGNICEIVFIHYNSIHRFDA